MKSKKDRIIDAARGLFSKKGFSATGLRDISVESEVSLGNIYYYFKNKEEIFREIITPDAVIFSLSKPLGLLNENFPANIGKIILSAKKIINENAELYRLIFIDLIEFNGAHTNRIIERVIEFAKKAFNERINTENSELGLKDMDYDLLVKSFIVSQVSFFLAENILPSAKFDGYTDEDISGLFGEILLHGIMK